MRHPRVTQFQVDSRAKKFLFALNFPKSEEIDKTRPSLLNFPGFEVKKII